MYTISECTIAILFVSAVIIVISILIFVEYKIRVDSKWYNLNNDYSELSKQYNNLDYEFKEYKESTAIYAKEQEKKTDQIKLLHNRLSEEATKLWMESIYNKKEAKIYKDVIDWFMDSVDKNQASKAMTYVKCLKAIEESRKIDLQNQKPDGTTNRADSHLFSPSEAPGKPL